MKKAKEAAVQYQTDTASISWRADLIEQLRQAAEWNDVQLQLDLTGQPTPLKNPNRILDASEDSNRLGTVRSVRYSRCEDD